MPVQYYVAAVFKDHKGGRASVKLMNPVGLTNFVTMNDAEDFAKGIAKYSRAALMNVSSGGSDFIGDVPDGFGLTTTIAGEHYDRVQQKLVIYYRSKSTGKIISIQVPAPNDNCFDDQEVKGDVLEDIADIIGSASNYASGDLVPIRAGLRSKLAHHQDLLVRTGV